MRNLFYIYPLILGKIVITLSAQGQNIELPAANASPIGELPKPPIPSWIVPTEFPKRAELADCTNGEVHVTIVLETDQKSRPYLAARLTPNPGYFLSSKDLPEGFVGIATRFTLVTNAIVQARGPVFEDTPAQEVLEEPDCVASYYPAGTVTLRLPVMFTKVDSDTSAQVTLEYSASNSNVCVMPKCTAFDIRISAATLSAIGIRDTDR